MLSSGWQTNHKSVTQCSIRILTKPGYKQVCPHGACRLDVTHRDTLYPRLPLAPLCLEFSLIQRNEWRNELK